MSRELQLMLRCDANRLEPVPHKARRRSRMLDSHMEIGKNLCVFYSFSASMLLVGMAYYLKQKSDNECQRVWTSPRTFPFLSFCF